MERPLKVLRRSKDESNNVVSFAEERLGKLEHQYEFRNSPAVKEFIRKNEYLTELLLEARQRIREYFGPDVSAALDVIREPGAKNGGRLFVLILTTLRPKEAVSRLEELDQGWWLDVILAARGKLTIDIDYG